MSGGCIYPQSQNNWISGEMLWHGLIIDITERMCDEAEIKRKNEELTKSQCYQRQVLLHYRPRP